MILRKETDKYFMRIKRINDSDLRLLYDNMIVQENNLNSYSMVSIFDDEVYKIYVKEDFKSKQNIKIIKREFNYSFLEKFEELVLPNSIIKYNNHIVGFTMPYINGVTLSKLYNCNDKELLKNVFYQILDLIEKYSKLSVPFSIGDLHEDNIIVDSDDKIHIIDCDSFIINNNEIYNDNNVLYYGKYIEYGELHIHYHSYHTDYYCVLLTLINLLLCKNNIELTKYYYNVYVTNDNYINQLLESAYNNINNFILDKKSIEYIIDNMDNIVFIRQEQKKGKKIYRNISDDELDEVIRKVRTL